MRLKLTIAYDGRPYRGWQSQAGGTTVQDTIQEAIGKITGSLAPASGDEPESAAKKELIHGSGRTDTGVHALGQVAHFDPPAGDRMGPGEWLRALNGNLPPAIRILECAEVPPDFHARFSAKAKEYRYRIYTGEVLPPLLHGLVWHIPQGLDCGPLDEACQVFVGTHDFRKFAANRGTEAEKVARDPARSTRTIHQITVCRPAPDHIDLEFRGTGFLYKMVRILAGSAVRCARHQAELSWLRDLLHEPLSALPKSNQVAPAGGLYLVRVTYP